MGSLYPCCYSNRFNSINELIEFLDSEVELLSLKIIEIHHEINNNEQKQYYVECDLSIKKVKNCLDELSYFLSRINVRYTNKRATEIFISIQEVIDYYFMIKRRRELVIASSPFYFFGSQGNISYIVAYDIL